MLKQRVQLSGQSAINCAKNIFKNEGFVSFYRSLPITLFMNAPYSITTVMVNENLKKIIEPKKRRFTFLSYFSCAALAGSFASIVTCPMDIIKTKLQTQNEKSTFEKIDTTKKSLINDTNKEPSIKYKDIISTAKIILQEDGFSKGFFKGVTPRILSNSPSCAISWGTYEIVKHLLSQKTISK
jgi:solute carrier family 25 iron transporter 28/37